MNNGMVFFILCDLVMTGIITLGCGAYLAYRIQQDGRLSWYDYVIVAFLLFFAWAPKITGTGW